MPKTIPLIATSLSLPFLLFTPPALAAVLPAMPPSINIHAGPLGQVQVGGLFAFAGRAQSNVYPGASGPAGKTFSAAVSEALRHFEWVRRYDCLVERSASRGDLWTKGISCSRWHWA